MCSLCINNIVNMEGDNDTVLEMMFFTYAARDLIGEHTDILMTEFLSSSSSVPTKISRFIGRLRCHCGCFILLSPWR